MRWALLILGGGLTLTAVGLALDSWSTAVNPEIRHRAFAEIRVGMTYQQVRSRMGEAGKGQFLGTGSVTAGHSGGAPIFFDYRWEDAHTVVDVRFRGSCGSPGQERVEAINRQEKEVPDFAPIRQFRLELSLLALSGLALLSAGLYARPKPLPPPSNPQSA